VLCFPPGKRKQGGTRRGRGNEQRKTFEIATMLVVGLPADVPGLSAAVTAGIMALNGPS
jgi:hypothetical protein